MVSLEVFTQFTEDAIAQEDHVCQCPSCAAKICKGEPCHYIATVVHGQPGRFVCGACYQHYQRKAATGVQPSGVRLAGRHSPDLQNIWQSVNAAQRSSSIQPPPVVATSYGRNALAGPKVVIPSSWRQNSHPQPIYAAPVPQQSHSAVYAAPVPQRQSHSAIHTAPVPGYSVNHAQKAYSTPPAETISLELSAVQEGGNKRKGGRGIGFGNICEGMKDVDAQINAPGLVALALDTIRPKIEAFAPGFLWRQDKFIVRDGAWVDLATHPENVPYFYSQCLHPSRKVSVVVPMAQWNDYESWLDKIEEEDLNHRHCPASPVVTSLFHTVSTVAPSSEASSKRQFRSETQSSSLPPSHPHKKPALNFCSPDHNRLRDVLQSGGTMDLDVCQVLNLQNKNIHFFPILKRPLSEILDKPQYHAFCLDPEACYNGQLTIDISSDNTLGAGAFKTAHPGWLTLFAAPESRLGSCPRQKVAVKRPFHKIYPPGGSTKAPGRYIMGRYAVADEIPKLFQEANVLYWAGPLLEFAYNYIDHCIARSTDPPPFTIPQLRFVEAGLALSYSQAPRSDLNQKSKGCPPRAGFLLEELIGDDDSRNFIKYIHNMDCNPLLDPDEFSYDIAAFLACTQHIQYTKTGGLAFISDYQGDAEILTDPQVLTHPTFSLVSKGKNIFGDGNLEVEVTVTVLAEELESAESAEDSELESAVSAGEAS
ncbi:hypothetical protein EDB19DRAFT_1831293 [Suillus lakei]|nr:hypothetical protein EDB19DRAFT_1831293 [Suillus lakei]